MIATIYRVTLKAQARKGRMAALLLLGAVGVLVGLAIGLSDVRDPLEAATNMINAFGLSLYAPVIVKYRDERTNRAVQLEDFLR